MVGSHKSGSLYMSVYLSVRNVRRSICRSLGRSICRSECLSDCLSVDFSVGWYVDKSAFNLSICLSVGLSICRFVGLSVDRYVDLWRVYLAVCMLASRSEIGTLVCLPFFISIFGWLRWSVVLPIGLAVDFSVYNRSDDRSVCRKRTRRLI